MRQRLAAREVTPASAGLALFVAGVEVPAVRVRGITDRELVEGDEVLRARYAVLPLGGSLVVCDWPVERPGRDHVCWPDDSSYHLALSLPPGRVARWIDLGCGSAFAPLLRPGLAEQIVASDVNARAVEMARKGAELSGVAMGVVEGDLGEGIEGGAQLVSCNAPIPGGGEEPVWRATAEDFMGRLFARAQSLLAPGGMIVVHGALDAIEPVVAGLAGERVVVRYTPADVRRFGVVWWRPDGEDRLVTGHRPLTADRPHLGYADREAVIV